VCLVRRRRGGRWLAAAAIVVLAAAAGGVIAWRHASAPQLTVQVAVYGAQAVAAPEQPGIDYGGSGHMVPPGRATTTVQQSPTDASVVLTTPAGRTRQTDQTLPWQRTITLHPGQEVTVSVRSGTATSLECTISVDGKQVAKQDAARPGTITCQARS
jgi:hypothetical protein